MPVVQHRLLSRPAPALAGAPSSRACMGKLNLCNRCTGGGHLWASRQETVEASHGPMIFSWLLFFVILHLHKCATAKSESALKLKEGGVAHHPVTLI